MTDLAARVREAVAASLALEPFLGFLLAVTPIYVDEEAPFPYTDGDAIYLTPHYEKADGPTLRHVLLHEAAHIAYRHPQRVKAMSPPPELHLYVNMFADAQVERALGTHEAAELFKQLAKATGIPTERLGAMSLEEFIRELMRRAAPELLGATGGTDGLKHPARGRRRGHGAGGDVLPEYDVVRAPGARRRLVKEGEGFPVAERILRAYAAAKSAGRTPGWADRIVEELLKPKVDWREALKAALDSALGRDVRRSWARLNRKDDELPGKALARAPGDVAILVDVSGSIGDEELARYLTETYALVRQYQPQRAWLLTWDTRVTSKWLIKNAADVARAAKTGFKGGGGTTLAPPLREAAALRPKTLIIFSDWVLADAEEAEKELRKFPRIIAITTANKPPELPNVTAIRIEP